MMTLLQIVSDLHLEVQDQYALIDIPAAAPYLILAGDIGRLVEFEAYLSFLERHVAKFELILLVCGNHEFYGTSHVNGLERANELVKDGRLKGKVVLLNQASHHLPESETSIVGCTLWSAIPEANVDVVMSRVKDHQQIKDWSIDLHNRCHRRDLAWLRYEVESIHDRYPNRRIVVVTHHAPCVDQTSKPQYEGSAWSCAFATDLLKPGDWKGVDTWVFGHTHFSTEFKKHGIRVVANQRGPVLDAVSAPKAKADNPWNAQKVINI
jgi:predicted phosphodiesterase